MRPLGLSKVHQIKLAGHLFVPDHSGALFWPAENLLLVADLHLEHGVSLARRGIHVPPYDTQATLAQLEQVLKATAAQKLILLGDSFHDDKAHRSIEPDIESRLLAITSATQTIWISGNHDPIPPSRLGGTTVDELAIGSLLLRHIPSHISSGGFEISGHLHPGATIFQRGHRVHAKCFVSDGQRLILPAFGSYTGGLNVRSKAFAGLLDPKRGEIWMIGKSAIHHFPLSRAG